MSEEKLDKEGLKKVWLKFWTLVKVLVGDVDVEGKGNLQTQINDMGRKVQDCFQSASDGKELVANAVTGKGVPTLASDTFATMAANIAKIKTAARLQSKSAALNTSTTSVTLKPDNGYDGLSQVTATITLQEKTQSLLHGTTSVTPDSGKVLSKVTVNGPEDRSGLTVDAGAVMQDDNYTYLSVPAAGYYDTNSKLRSANSDLARNIDIIATYNDTNYADNTTHTINSGNYDKLLLVITDPWASGIPLSNMSSEVNVTVNTGNIKLIGESYRYVGNSRASSITKIYIIDQINDDTITITCSSGNFQVIGI